MRKLLWFGPVRVFLGICFTLAITLSELVLLQAAQQFRVVAATGEPSGVGNYDFASFAGMFDATDRVILSGLIVDPEGNYTSGIWQEGSHGLAPSLVNGQQAPGFPSGVVLQTGVRLEPIVPSGFATTASQVFGDSLTTYQDVVYTWGPNGQWRLASYEGQPATNFPSATIAAVQADSSSVVLSNANGSVAVEGEMFGLEPDPLNETPAIWVDRGQGPEVAFHLGMQAPGFPTGTVIASLKETGIDHADRVAVLGSVENNAGHQDALWLFDPRADPQDDSARQLLTTIGTTVDGYTINSLSHVQMAGGAVASLALVVDDAGVKTQAILSDLATSPRIVAHGGKEAPGLGPDAVFSGAFYERWTTNHAGDFAFFTDAGEGSGAGYTGGFWIETSGESLELVLLESDLEVPSHYFPVNLVINDAGQMAFELLPPPARGGPSLGAELWFFDPVQGAQRVVATGDRLALSIGGETVQKTLLSMSVGGFRGNLLPASRYLSESGEVLFQAGFADGSYALVSWTPVPEPSAAVLLLVSVLSILGLDRGERNREAKMPAAQFDLVTEATRPSGID